MEEKPLKERSNNTVLKEYGISRRDLEIETHDLIIKVNELLNEHELWGDDGTYTFNDGERWARFDMEAYEDE